MAAGVAHVGMRAASPARRRRAILEHLEAYAFLLPALVIIGVFELISTVVALVMSTTRWGVIYERWVGLDNYRAILDPDGSRFGEFVNALGVTLWYVLLTVPIQMAIALVLAFVLFGNIAGRGAYRTIYFLPHITSIVAAAIVFQWIYDQNVGLLNWLVGLVGIGAQQWLRESDGVFALVASGFGASLPDWAAGPSLALASVSIYTIWYFVGFQAVIFMAGLANISKEYYEAARIDGASERQIFTKITLPLLSPTTFFVLIIATVGAMRSFNQIYVLTNGGPLDTTRNVPMLIFRTFFERTANNGIGVGAAMSFLFVAIIVVITIIQFRVVGRRVHYT